MAETLLTKFATLFCGRADVWGALHGQAVKETVTEDPVYEENQA